MTNTPEGTPADEPGEPSLSNGDDDGSGQPPAEPEPPRLTLTIEGDEPADVDLPALKHAVGQALEWLHLETGELAIRIIGDDEMATLHAQFSEEPGTTDVLTFDHTDAEHARGETATVIDADIAVCHDVARRESAKRNHSITRELVLYIIHGILHCLGYDDHNEQDYEKIHQREDEILEAIGIGRTFGSET